jgi:cytochrome subunit of sulfide dehydrogenase
MWALAACSALLSGSVMAQPAAPAQSAKNLAADARTGEQTLYLKALAATCANCHGTEGRSAEGASIASLAGLDKAYIAQQMKDFKSGVRPATVMHQLSKGYSDAQIDALAGYFAAQPK